MLVKHFLVSTRKISFYHHINAAIFKAKKGLGIIKSLSNIFPRNSLLTIYKSFIRPNLDYCDFIYDQQWVDDSFCIKVERTALAITVAKKVTSQTKLCKEMVRVSLSLEDVSGNFAPFLKLIQMLNQNIPSFWSQQFSILAIPEVCIRLRIIIVEQTLLKILFSHIQ